MYQRNYSITDQMNAWTYSLANAVREHGFTAVRIVRVDNDRDPNGLDTYVEGTRDGQVARFRNTNQLYDWLARA